MTATRTGLRMISHFTLAFVVSGAGVASAQKPFPGTKKLFYIAFPLRSDTVSYERGCLEALPGVARALDGILLSIPSYHEAPEAPAHPHVQRALQLCREHGLEVYWGRHLWVSWPERSSFVQQREDVFSAAYYATYLTRLDAEAKRLGVAGTFAYGEPHGKSIFRDQWFKRTGFTNEERRRIQDAIKAAVRVAPRATMAYPAGGGSPEHFGYTLRLLGERFLFHKTYRARNADSVKIRPPAGVQPQLHWWGSWLTMDSGAEPGKGALTVDDWLRLDLAGNTRRYPELQEGGLWIYVDASERKEVMLELGKKVAPTPSSPPAAGGQPPQP